MRATGPNAPRFANEIGAAKKLKRNATNRSKLTHGHCSGSRSFLNTQAMGRKITSLSFVHHPHFVLLINRQEKNKASDLTASIDISELQERLTNMINLDRE
ncbi:Uncharacterized protein Fot_06666 [Forsythia ovata]|uniref:Uncharacterized protein n=1 Tax=Forsythia ovata TaxID=205694 RepID=A0ABD1WTL5_9LAMI